MMKSDAEFPTPHQPQWLLIRSITDVCSSNPRTHIHLVDAQYTLLGDAYGDLHEAESACIMKSCPCTPCLFTSFAEFLFSKSTAQPPGWRASGRHVSPEGTLTTFLGHPPRTTRYTYRENEAAETPGSEKTITRYARQDAVNVFDVQICRRHR
jgi:hypothetical protein